MGIHVATSGRSNSRAIAAALVAVIATLTVIVGFGGGTASAQTCPSGSSTTTAAGGTTTTPTTRPPTGTQTQSQNARVEGQSASGAVAANIAAAPTQTCPSAKTGANMVFPLVGGAGAIVAVLAVRRLLAARNLA